MRCAVPIGIARLPSGSRSLRPINTNPLFAVALLRRQAAAPSSAAMMRAAPKPVGVNPLRAFGFGHYLSCISELVSGVRELSWSHGTHAKPVAGRAEHGIGRPDHTLLRTRAKVNPYRSQLLELFRKPNLAPCCSVIAREKGLQVRQNCLLKDFAAFVCAHRRLIRPQAHRI